MQKAGPLNEATTQIKECVYNGRKKVMDEFITYFYIRVGNQSGVVGITESSNHTMTIMAPPKSEE